MEKITKDLAREMSVSELAESKHPTARRQHVLRTVGAANVKGVLRAVKNATDPTWRGYSGESGWHIVACVSPEQQIGFVNIAQGVAVLTDEKMPLEVIEALTIPEQVEGVLASGAAVWTSPDAGLGGHAEAPRGWKQLVVDLRGEVEAVACRAYVCAWGLRTCYLNGHRGAPGATGLDDPRNMPVQLWPLDAEHRTRLRDAGKPILERMALHLAELANIPSIKSILQGEEEREWLSSEARVGRAMYVVQQQGLLEYGSLSPAQRTLRSAINSTTDVIPRALRRNGVEDITSAADVSNVGGLRYFDLLTEITRRILSTELAPVAEALWAAAEPHVARTRKAQGEQLELLLSRLVRPQLYTIASTMADGILTGVTLYDGHLRNLDAVTLYDALYAKGYIQVHIKLQQRTPPDME